MGIYDRDYYQDNQRGFLSTLANSGQVCKYLIVANAIAFILQLVTSHTGIVTWAFELDTERVAHGEVWRLLTYAFLHSPDDLFHLVFNMLFLWWFGKEMEDLYGSLEFLAFYLVAALIGGVAFEIWGLSRPETQVCIGASGAVVAVLMLYAMHYPRRVIYLFFVIPVPIWGFVAYFLIRDALDLLNQTPTGTAVVVHLSGAAFGFCYGRLGWRLMSLWPDLAAWRRQRRRPRLKVYREDTPRMPVAVAAPPLRDIDEQLEAKVDAVLEKVARSGQASLNDSERQLLLRASEIYRKKRL